MKNTICLTFLGSFVLLASGVAQAGVILDTGVISFSATGSQYGRISRNGAASIWGVSKTFPGVTGAPTVRGDETFTIQNLDRQYLQISVDDPDVALFDAAYLNSFAAVNTSPNYGLDVNYLGDPGNSEPEGFPSAFQIVVPTNSTVVININELNPGAGAGHPFELVVEGFYDSSFSDAPEPSTVLMGGGGALLLAAAGYRRRLAKG